MIAYITELTDDNYNKFVENGLVLVDVHATWCNPCKIIGPIIDELSSDFQGRVSVGKLNADTSGQIISDLGIRNIPTILIYKDGEVVERLVGVTPKNKLTELINSYL
jgi:thioredoxin 1